MAETWLENGTLTISINDGKIGINTTVPGYIAHFKDTVKPVYIQLQATATDKNAGIILTTKTNEWIIRNAETSNNALVFADSSGTEMYLTTGGNLVIDGKITETGCPADIKEMWKDVIRVEAVKPEPPRDAKGRIDKPRKINDEGKEVIDNERMEDFVKTYYHNTGEMVMALAHGLLEAHDKIDDLQAQINDIRKQLK